MKLYFVTYEGQNQISVEAESKAEALERFESFVDSKKQEIQPVIDELINQIEALNEIIDRSGDEGQPEGQEEDIEATIRIAEEKKKGLVEGERGLNEWEKALEMLNEMTVDKCNVYAMELAND